MERKGTTKNRGIKHPHDKFYTNPKIAAELIQLVDISKYDVIIEPSAGSGSFSTLINNCLAFDIEPEHPDIISQNWLNYTRERDAATKLLVIGNPPFGQQNSLAVQFINHAAKFANTVAFILPKSFMKDSLQNRINRQMHLQHSHALPRNSFLLLGETVDVPCVFQIWEWSTHERELPKPVTFAGVQFVTKAQNPDFFIQRIGGRAGKAGLDYEERSKISNYFLRNLTTIPTPELVNLINHMVFPERDNSSGPRSISKPELLSHLKRNLEN